MVQAGDGNLVIAGGTGSSGAGEVDMLLLKVDREGNEKWAHTYGTGEGEEDMYLFPNMAHGVMRSDPYALEIGLQFLDEPLTEPDSSCLEGLGGLDFD